MKSAKYTRSFEKLRLDSIQSTAIDCAAILMLAAAANAGNLVPTTPSPRDYSRSDPFPRGLSLVTVYGGITEQPTGFREQLAFAPPGSTITSMTTGRSASSLPA